jgi:23S rRNA (pseudouridine1915-N3)-methyltransferase
MMKITILCVGKLKEGIYREAVGEYEKRLGRYCKVEIVEVADERIPERAGNALLEQVRVKEGERLLAKVKEDAFLVALDMHGEPFTSEEFAQWMAQAEVRSFGHIVFIIGGSVGLHEMVKRHVNQMISFSKMTFPHQLMRVILCEQLYRSYQIRGGGAYHK